MALYEFESMSVVALLARLNSALSSVRMNTAHRIVGRFVHVSRSGLVELIRQVVAWDEHRLILAHRTGQAMHRLEDPWSSCRAT